MYALFIMLSLLKTMQRSRDRKSTGRVGPKKLGQNDLVHNLHETYKKVFIFLKRKFMQSLNFYFLQKLMNLVGF